MNLGSGEGIGLNNSLLLQLISAYATFRISNDMFPSNTQGSWEKERPISSRMIEKNCVVRL